MLRLDRKSRDGQVSIVVRDKQLPWNRTLAVAFVIAASLHLTFFILFQITPIKIALISTLLPPVTVDTEAPLFQAAAIVKADAAPLSIPGIPSPPLPQPAMGASPDYFPARPASALKETQLTDDIFFSAESALFRSVLTLPPTRIQAPLDFRVSGLLAESTLASSAITLPESLKPQVGRKPLLISFETVVDGRSGVVIWYTPKQLSGISAVDMFAEKAVRSLRFAPRSDTLTIAGEVELQINAEAL